MDDRDTPLEVEIQDSTKLSWHKPVLQHLVVTLDTKFITSSGGDAFSGTREG